jgi:hypothetical protein
MSVSSWTWDAEAAATMAANRKTLFIFCRCERGVSGGYKRRERK